MVFESEPEAYLSSFLTYRYVILFEPMIYNALFCQLILNQFYDVTLDICVHRLCLWCLLELKRLPFMFSTIWPHIFSTIQSFIFSTILLFIFSGHLSSPLSCICEYKLQLGTDGSVMAISVLHVMYSEYLLICLCFCKRLMPSI